MQQVGEARVLLSYPQFQDCHVPAFYVIVGDLESRLQACTASILPTRPAPLAPKVTI